MKVAALCAGYGGLELGLTHAGLTHQLTWYAETDPAPANVTNTHHTAPNLGNICDITDPPNARPPFGVCLVIWDDAGYD